MLAMAIDMRRRSRPAHAGAAAARGAPRPAPKRGEEEGPSDDDAYDDGGIDGDGGAGRDRSLPDRSRSPARPGSPWSYRNEPEEEEGAPASRDREARRVVQPIPPSVQPSVQPSMQPSMSPLRTRPRPSSASTSTSPPPSSGGPRSAARAPAAAAAAAAAVDVNVRWVGSGGGAGGTGSAGAGAGARSDASGSVRGSRSSVHVPGPPRQHLSLLSDFLLRSGAAANEADGVPLAGRGLDLAPVPRRPASVASFPVRSPRPSDFEVTAGAGAGAGSAKTERYPFHSSAATTGTPGPLLNPFLHSAVTAPGSFTNSPWTMRHTNPRGFGTPRPAASSSSPSVVARDVNVDASGARTARSERAAPQHSNDSWSV
eukprot:tig00020902_g14978.t1